MRQMERDMARYGDEEGWRGEGEAGRMRERQRWGGEGKKRRREECQAKLPGRARADKAPCVRA